MNLREKPKLQWRSQGIGDARNMKHLLRKAAGSKQSQSKREARHAVGSRAAGIGLRKPLSVYITLRAQDAGRDLMFSLLDFVLLLVLFFLSVPSFLPFGMEMFILCLCILKVCNLFSLLQGLTAKSLP
jgi:hypothetical protein